MANMTADQIGHKAEVIVALHLSRLVGAPFQRLLFRSVHLGAKYPTADYLVDVLGTDRTHPGHFFLQVKGTGGASPTAPRLAIDVAADEFNRLVSFPAPVYLVGGGDHDGRSLPRGREPAAPDRGGERNESVPTRGQFG
jgi:hypothetical protein